MPRTKLHQLGEFGQSIWFDYISRSLIEGGKLRRLIDDGLRGMTSNPTIFHRAISSTQDYDEMVMELKEAGKTNFEIYDDLTTRDVREAADLFKQVYDQTNGLDGYVSLEINPQLARAVDEQIEEGLRLFQKVNRPNLMIKVPATKEGCFVIEELLAKGVNVNATLIFSVEQYSLTIEAFLKGLKRLAEENRDLSKIQSVASVFISRLDVAVDQLLEEKIKNETHLLTKERLRFLKGKVAVANARIIFGKFHEFFAKEEFRSLSKLNANVQRVLWASTSTKDPSSSDIKYVTELIANPTVNTLPEKTLEAFMDHGIIQEAFKGDVSEAEKLIVDLRELDIDVNKICDQLQDNGLLDFEKSFDALMNSIEEKSRQLCGQS